MQPFDHAGREEIAVEVGAEPLLDAGPQDLDSDVAAVAVPVDGDGLVHLRDRGGGHRRPKTRKVILEFAAERLFDCGTGMRL